AESVVEIDDQKCDVVPVIPPRAAVGSQQPEMQQLQHVAPAEVAAPSIDMNAESCAVDRDYCNGKLSNGGCPHGCDFTGSSSFARTMHYKRYHNNVFYSLGMNDLSAIDRWTSAQFGDVVNEDRVCVHC
ncbi:hypothetical protein PMAYCL1PPCAC_28260, partial [Pristionchus mayeri]